MCGYCKYANRLLASTVAMIMAGSVHAVEFMDGRLQLHGFLTQGIVFTSDNNFFGDSKDGSLDYREIGANLSWRLNPDLQVSAQLLSRRAGENDDGDVRFDYALVDWAPFSGEWGRAGARIGRFKNPYGLYNKTRDVAFTRPSILLPQSIYFDRTRNLAMASDGVELYLERYAAMGTLSVNLGLGWPEASDRATEAALFGRNRPGELDSDFTQLMQVMYEGDGGRYRLGVTAAWVNVDYARKSDPVLRSGHFDFDPLIFSAQYNAERWSLTGEYALRKTRFRDFGTLLDNQFTGESYYIQGTYQLRPGLDLLLRYDVLYSDRDDRDGKDYAAATGLPGFMRYAKDWTAGLRFDVTSSFMVRAELHRVEGTGWIPSLDNPNPLDLEKHWDMLLFIGSFRF